MTRIKHVSVIAVLLIVFAHDVVFADTALHNINGYTSTNDGIRAFSVLVFDDEGKVVATGDDKILAAFPNATLRDGQSKTVLPGLIDAHGHVLGLGVLKANLDLTGTPSVDHAVAAIAAYAAAKPDARWILGRGWNQVIWPVKEFPLASQIDAVVNDRPVYLRRIDGHAAWANSAAIQIAAIDDDTPDPVGGKIVRDANGHATGVLIDLAMGLIDAKCTGNQQDRHAGFDSISGSRLAGRGYYQRS